jgi:hypothetical protein
MQQQIFQEVDQSLLSEGMALAMSEHDQYLQGRDRKAVQPYTLPVQPIRTEDPTTVIFRAGKPVAALSLLVGGVYLVGVAVVSVGAAIMAFVAANAWAIGGGALGVALVSGFFAARSGEEKTIQTKTAGAPTINVVVNVAGQNVSNGTK